jgi:hypothetical protein
MGLIIKYLSAVVLTVLPSITIAGLIYTEAGTSVGGQSFNEHDYSDENKLSVSQLISSGFSSTVSSSAYAKYGALRVYTSGNSFANVLDPYSNSENIYGYAGAKFQDSLTIGSSQHAGKKGLLTVAVYNEILIDTFSNFLDGTASRARYGFDFGMSTPYLGIDDSRIVINVNSGSSLSGDNTQGGYSANDYFGSNYSLTYDKNFFLITQEFVFGTPLYMYMSTWGDGSVYSAFPHGDIFTGATFIVDAGNSSYWGGIQSISVDGSDITEYDLISGSGTDYSSSFVPTSNPPASVPEPNALALLSLGIACMVYLRRRVCLIKNA